MKLYNKEHEKFSVLLYCYPECSTQFKLRGTDWLLTHWTNLILFSSPEMVTKEGSKDRAAEIDLTRIFLRIMHFCQAKTWYPLRQQAS